MKQLYLKKWYQHNNCPIKGEKYEDIKALEIEDNTKCICGSTEKAVKLVCAYTNGYKKWFNIVWIPKSALVVLENENDNEHYEEMNKVENKELALNEVNEYLASTNIPSYNEAIEYLR